MNGSKQKQIILKEMRNIYYKDISPRYDWMGFLITEENKPSYHHIVKAEELKRNEESYDATVENGAYLGKVSHEMLHVIEQLDEDLYESWNNVFRIINESKKYPDEEMWTMVYYLRKESEKLLSEHKKSKSLINK
jgi:hypothetical protein